MTEPVISEKVEKWATKLGRWVEDEDFAERLATKLSVADLQQLMEEVECATMGKLIRWCQFVMIKPTQRERLAILKEMANRQQPGEEEP